MSGLDALVGRWRGRGVADFPTIDRVEYDEELDIEWDGARGVLCYRQAVVLADGRASHRESGFLRANDDGVVTLWNAQDNGRTEVLEGTSSVDPASGDTVVDVRSVHFGNDPRMLSSRRTIRVNGERLSYSLAMSTTTTENPAVLSHLECELRREE